MTPMTAPQILEMFFLDARSRLLDLAAMLDRIDRSAASDTVASDPRIRMIHEALAALSSHSGDRAEAIQRIFSLEYDPNWVRPTPR